MSIFEHSRFEIYHAGQHPYKHTLEDFAYTNPAAAGEISTVQHALDWIFAVLYPNTQDAVDETADLPSVGNTLNDYRVVLDDGDGKAAGYRWEQREGDASAKWYKIYDMDWGADSILQSFYTKTQDIYVHKYGFDDLDDEGTAVTGDLAGQSIYGGRSASTNLTLRANAGDGVGAATGYVQFGDNARPLIDSTYSLGTTAYRFLKVWTDEITSGTLTATGGSITDSSGAISFADENLSTTGTLASGTHTIGNMVVATGSITNTGGAISFDNENLTTTGTFQCAGLTSGTHVISSDLTLSTGSIVSASGAISFGDENLTTTGTLGAGNTTVTRLDVDNVRVDGNTVSITNTDGNLTLQANGTGVVAVSSDMTTGAQTVTGTVGITGQLDVDNISINGNTISSTDTNGLINLAPDGSGHITVSSKIFPTADGTLDLGGTSNRFNNVYFDGAIGDGTTTIAQSVLQSLRDINSSVDTGYTLFWDGDQWVSSAPDTEIDHGTISGLSDDDHTQYVLLAGRSGGQSIIGGTAASNDLTLESTSNVTKGDIKVKDDVIANTDASYSGSWSGTDLGGSSNRFRHLYTAGEAFGLRLENVSTALPASSSQRTGRLVYFTDEGNIYFDNGSSLLRSNILRYEEDTSWDGLDDSKAVTVSGLDARKAIWQLKDNTNNFEVMHVQITSTGATNVTITANGPLPAGSYRLIGIQ